MSDRSLREAERAAATGDPAAVKRLGHEQCRAFGHPPHATIASRLGDVLEAWTDEWGNPGERTLAGKLNYDQIRAQTSDGPRYIASWWCERCGERTTEVLPEAEPAKPAGPSQHARGVCGGLEGACPHCVDALLEWTP
jgi:hypothetical protein